MNDLNATIPLTPVLPAHTTIHQPTRFILDAERIENWLHSRGTGAELRELARVSCQHGEVFIRRIRLLR